MSGISTGVGLLSGLPTQSIIDQLIQIESRPLVQLQNRLSALTEQRTAFTDLTARLLGLKSTIARFDEVRFFRSSKATTSNESVLVANADEDAIPGSFRFQVKSLVTNHQLIGKGFFDADTQRVGAGTLTIETGHGRLDVPTSLDVLNGGNGIRRGTVEIIDASGARADVDLTTTLSVEDVVRQINRNVNVDVLAQVEGDHLVIQDKSGGAGTLTVRDKPGGFAAADLGIAAQAGEDGRITGNSIIYLSDATRLSKINDGNGVAVGKLNSDIVLTAGSRTFNIGLRGILAAGVTGSAAPQTALDVLNSGAGVRDGTLRITNRAGQSADITIDQTNGPLTVGDVIELINNAGIDVSASVGAARGQLVLTDNSTVPDGQDPQNFVIEDVTGHTAADLGILADTEDGSVIGSVIYSINTVGDVMRAINYAVDAEGNKNDVVEARIGSTGLGIELAGLSGGEFSVAAGDDTSQVAKQLGILGDSSGGQITARNILAGLNTVLLSSLRGGSGVETGLVKLVAADGSEAEVDLTGAQTIQDVIDRVNAANTGDAASHIRADLNSAGNGIAFIDESGVAGQTRVRDMTGNTVRDLFGLGDTLGAVVETDTGRLDAGSAQLQYVSRNTRLSELNAGRGIANGRFTIFARDGRSAVINIGENQKTVGDVLDLINAAPLENVEARINANGDGIEIVDQSQGEATFRVEPVDGATTAADLNLTRASTTTDGDDGQSVATIDGSYEYRLNIDADDTLNDVRTKLNELDINVRATLINDGSDNTPFHLILNSETSGRRGQLVVDTGDTGLSFDTLVRAQDAVVFFGGSDSDNPIVLTSPTNQLTDVIDNVTIDLLGTSDTPVEVSVSKDIDRIASDMKTFVSSYNGVLDRLGELTAFNPETNQRGTLFGDNTIDIVRSRLRNVINKRVDAAPPGFDRLLSVGLRTGTGGQLSFDEARFREAYAENPQAVEALFTTEENGIGDQLNKTLDDLTRDFDGLLTRKDDTLQAREDQFNRRIDDMQEALDRKRAQLERQFQGLETSLAGLQDAQNAISSLASLAGASL